MNELKLIELIMTTPGIFLIFALVVWLLTYIVKKPIKRITSKIKDEKKRKLYNKWILVIPFILATIVLILYHGFRYNEWFTDFDVLMSEAFSVAVFSIVIYNIFADITGKKSEYETTDDGKQLFNLLLVYAKDKNKVKMLLDQCRENFYKGSFTITDTVKAWLPESADAEVVNTIVKVITAYFDSKKDKVVPVDDEIL